MRRSPILTWLCLLLLPGAAIANPIVFVSPDPPVDPGGPVALPPGQHSLILWLQTGSIESNTGGGEVVCEDGNGDEICGFQVEIEPQASFELVSFDPWIASDLVIYCPPNPGPCPSAPNQTPTKLVINRLQASQGGDSGILRLGTLTLNTPGDGQLVVGQNSVAIGAKLQQLSVGGSPIAALPEPGGAAMLGAGLVLLLCLGRRRRYGLAVLFVGAAVGWSAPPAGAQPAVPVTTRFDAGLEGWNVLGAGNSFTHEGTKGNLRGRGVVVDGQFVIGPAAILAPTAYLGDWRTLDGNGEISFQHNLVDAGDGGSTLAYSVVITSPFGTAERSAGFPGAVGEWKESHLSLSSTAWTLTGPWDSILSDVTKLHIVVDVISDDGTTGETVAIDNVRLDGFPDKDFDGYVNPDDNCEDLFNPNQADAEFDGVGDFCDNCRTVSNDTQTDTNGNGIGDACEPARVRLQFTGDFADPTWDLLFQCPGDQDVDGFAVGVVLPNGTTPLVEFGGGCEAPPNIDIGCTNGTNIGAIDPGRSGSIGPGLSSASGFREDTIYIVAWGPAGTPLCEAGDPEMFIGGLIAGPPPMPFPPDMVYATLTTQGLAFLPDIDINVPDPLQGDVNYMSQNLPPSVEVMLRPSAGEPQGAEENWDLCLTANTSARLHRLGIGMIAEPGTGEGVMHFEGCDTASSQGRRTCTSGVTQFIDSTESFTFGPFPVPGGAPPTFPMLANTLYVVLEGNLLFSGDSDPTLNPILHVAPDMECVGTVHYEDPGVMPSLTLDGTQLLPYHDSPPLPADAIQLADGLGGVDPQYVSGVVNTSVASDVDDDGYSDEADNCTYECNPSQDNNGMLLSTQPNAFGDACECADGNFTGAIFAQGEGTPDLDIIREHAAGADVDPNVGALCSVVDGIECTILDAVVLDLAIANGGVGPGLAPVCEAAVPQVNACP